jgi:nitroreductase
VPTNAPTQPSDAQADAPTLTQTMSQALAESAVAAGYAPSIHNTQPWRWRLTRDGLDLHLEPGRLLQITDPDTRLATLSCGAALNDARVSLAAQGWHATVTRMPDPADADHLAHLHIDEAAPVDPAALRRLQTIRRRHTDRRPLADTPISGDDLNAITTAVEAEETWLHILRPEQVLDLAASVDHAQRTQATEPAWQAELAYWTGGTRPAGTGIPDATIPREAPQTTVPGRDFGHHGGLPISAEHGRSAVFAMLYGRDDEPLAWLRAGEALSAGWLTAAERGVSVVPLSVVVEVAGTREIMRRLVADLGRPYLVLRLGTTNPHDAGAPPAPRLPADQIIERR